MTLEHQFTHDLLSLDFYRSLHDPDPEVGAHPSLRNAIFAVGCYYGGPPFASFGPVFQRRANYHSHESLAWADRLVDFIEANTLLAWCELYYGRYFTLLDRLL